MRPRCRPGPVAPPAERRSLLGPALLAGAVLLAFKAGLLIHDIAAWQEEPQPAVAAAMLAKAAGPPPVEPEVLPEPAAGPETPPASAAPMGGPVEPPADADADADSESPAAAAPVAAPVAPAPPPVMALDPKTLTAAEIAALQALAARREQLDARARELDTKAQLIDNANVKLAEQIERLAGLKAAVEGLIKQHQDLQDGKVQSLVKIYETMKPKAAAEIFNRLELPVLLQVVGQMREAKSSAILAVMDPLRARQITIELAKKIELPRLGS